MGLRQIRKRSAEQPIRLAIRCRAGFRSDRGPPPRVAAKPVSFAPGFHRNAVCDPQQPRGKGFRLLQLGEREYARTNASWAASTASPRLPRRLRRNATKDASCLHTRWRNMSGRSPRQSRTYSASDSLTVSASHSRQIDDPRVSDPNGRFAAWVLKDFGNHQSGYDRTLAGVSPCGHVMHAWERTQVFQSRLMGSLMSRCKLAAELRSIGKITYFYP